MAALDDLLDAQRELLQRFLRRLALEPDDALQRVRIDRDGAGVLIGLHDLSLRRLGPAGVEFEVLLREIEPQPLDLLQLLDLDGAGACLRGGRSGGKGCGGQSPGAYAPLEVHRPTPPPSAPARGAGSPRSRRFVARSRPGSAGSAPG